MKKLSLLLLLFLMLATLSACAPTSAYQARDNLQSASQEAADQARLTGKARKGLKNDTLKMKGDIKRIKEAERLFDIRSGIVLSY